MVSEDIELLYDKVLFYIDNKLASFDDPNALPTELSDYIEEYEMGTLKYAMQVMAARRPSHMEAKLIKAFRDLNAVKAEYDIRLHSRSDYYIDACTEENDNKEKWIYNKKSIGLSLLGKNEGN